MDSTSKDPEISGWVCIDDDGNEILGWGDTRYNAQVDAHEVIRDLLDEYLTESGIEVNLKYYQATESVMKKIREEGVENIYGKFVKWKGKDILSLKDEDIQKRCTQTPDMFK
jgi:hypothetical protein